MTITPAGSDAVRPATPAFVRTYAIRFAHCDPAGMVFFPQYLVLLNALVEDWFTLGLGIDYAQLIGARRIGLPTVSLQCEFVAPSRVGERLDFALSVDKLGRRSIGLAFTVGGAGVVRMRARQVLVTTSFTDDRAIDIPDDVRAAIARSMAEPTQTPQGAS